MDMSGFSVHLAECEDRSFSVLISLDGFESEQAASEFAHLILMDGSVAVGELQLAAGGIELGIH